jgi:TetR/AcrR family transcriptional regulator, transcriptional repressor for nem operon
MGYAKGRNSRNAIIEAASAVVLAKGYGTPTMGELAQAAGISAGKLTHHFPTKTDLFEAVFEKLMEQFRAGPLAQLSDHSTSPKQRIRGFFRGMLELYRLQPDPIGCPVGHAAGDAEGISTSMKSAALHLLKETEAHLAKAFRDLGFRRGRADVKAMLYVSAWQGAVVVARAGGGIKQIQDAFEALQSESALRPVA